jgi:hypothetical protein
MSDENSVNEEEETAEATPEMGDINTDFNLENDFKAEPLIPNGNYFGNVIEVKFDTEKGSINWKIALDGNGGFRSDGETPIDGSHIWYRNWLPKKGDESVPTSAGTGNKFQSKVNMLKKFADAMKLNMNTIAIIREAIEQGDYIGLEIIAKVGISEYPKGSGQFKNDCDGLVRV